MGPNGSEWATHPMNAPLEEVLLELFTRRGSLYPPRRIDLHVGADEGNRTPVSSLGSLRSTIEPHPRERQFSNERPVVRFAPVKAT